MQGAAATGDEVFAAQRRAMVDGQIRTFAVTDAAVIEAFLTVPRERFLPEKLRSLAYSDAILTLPADSGGEPRVLLQPMHLARLIQGAAVKPADRALVVGGGTGYAGCLMAALAASVLTLDSDASWAEVAGSEARELGLGNLRAATGKLTEGWSEGSPYDVILVQGAVETGLEALMGQLAPSGRLVTVEARGSDASRRTGKAVSLRRIDEDISARPLFDATVPVLPEFRLGHPFTF